MHLWRISLPSNRLVLPINYFISLTAGVALIALLFLLKSVGFSSPSPSGSDQKQAIPFSAHQEPSTDPNFVPGALILKIHPDFRAQCSDNEIALNSVNTLLRDWGVSKVKRNFPQAEPVHGQRNQLGQALVDITLIYELRCPDNTDIEAMAKAFSNLPEVVYAEPRYLYESFFIPDDPFVGSQWYNSLIGTFVAWDSVQGDSNIVIGIIDTGTNFNHNDLRNQVSYNLADTIDGLDNDGDGKTDNYRGWDFGGVSYWAPQDNDPTYVGNAPGMDHGVLVTGPACAQVNNATGIPGLGYHTQFVPLKAAVDQSISISFGMEAIVYGAEQGYNILNLSWGSSSNSQYGQDIVNYASINHNCLLVAACGNRFQDTYVYPASYENVISVAASQINDEVWDYGTGTGTTFNYWVDIIAPGRSIPTTTGVGSYWTGATGTSMSAPIVCAAAALVKALHPNLNNIQCGEYVRVTAEDIYGNNPAFLQDKIGLGRVDVERAVQATNVRSLRIDSLMVRDDDNDIPEPLDTMDLYVRFINYLDPINNLQVTLSTPDTNLIEVIQDSYTIPSMATLTSTTNTLPFKIRVKKNVTERTPVFVKFAYSEGSYQDYQYFRFYIQPMQIDLNQNTYQTSINGHGNFGYVDYPHNSLGLGIRYNASVNFNLDGSFLIGVSQTNLVDGMKSGSGLRSERFKVLEKAKVQIPGSIAPLEATAHFDDSDAGSHEFGIDVRQHCYQFNGGIDEKYIIMEYTISNRNNFPLNGVYAGLGNHWNRTFYNIRNANYYPNGNLVGAEASIGQASFVAGISMISDQQTNALNTDLSGYLFTDAEKFQALTNPTSNNQPRSDDVVQFISAGPFSMGANDSIRVAFAMVGGSDFTNLAEVAETARLKYWCEIRGQVPSLDLGPDLQVCLDDTLAPTLSTSGQPGLDFLWSTGDTSSSILADTSGTYQVTVTNQYGCISTDEVEVELSSLGNPVIGLDPGPYYDGTVYSFALHQADTNQTWNWNFGDGTLLSGDTLFNHTYQSPGVYTISITIDNGICTRTLDTTIIVQTFVANDQAINYVYEAVPNPFSSSIKVRFGNPYQGPVQLSLYDLNGKGIFNRQLAKDAYLLEEQLTLEGLSQGMYFLRLATDNSVYTKKIFRY